MAAGSRNINSNEAHDAPDAGADEEHGHKEARGDGAAGRPHSATKVHHQHHDQRRVPKLSVRASRQQVLDCVLACARTHMGFRHQTSLLHELF